MRSTPPTSTSARNDCADAYPPDLADPARRRWLRSAAGTAAVGAALPWLAPLSALAQTSTAGDYKALVCIFLFGGNDANNLIVPYETADYGVYRSARSNLALAQNTLRVITPDNTAGIRYGLHPAFAGIQQRFAAGQAAVVANVGPLVVPTTKAQYNARSVPLPNALFSHSDQQAAWQSAVPAGGARSGWGGRLMERLVDSGAANRGFAALSVSGGNLWQGGDVSLLPYKVGTSGDFGFDFYDPAGTDALSTAIAATLAEPRSHLLQQAWLDVMGRSIDVQRVLTQALATNTLATPFPNSDLGRQLQMVARLIAARAALGLPRQVFFASIGGFDTHGDDQLQRQQQLFTEIDAAMSALHQATVELGVDSQVTQFTASDFGRTLASNGQGSDHGWGSHQLVLGGAVRGRQLVGRFPDQHLGGPDDTGSGRWIPTTAVDQLGATLGKWFGASAGQVGEVFPQVGGFTADLGFMGAA